MKSALCLLLAAAATLPAEEIPPASALDRATVTIPYAELRSLWETAERARTAATPAKAPVPAVVHSAELNLRLTDGDGALEAVFDFEAFDARRQDVRLLAGDARLGSADAGERAIIWQDGYALLTDKPGRARVVLQLATVGSRAIAEARALKLWLPAAAVKRLTITGYPPGLEPRVNDTPPATLKDGSAAFALPGAEGEITIAFAPPQTEPPPPMPSVWQAQSQVLARAEDGRLRAVAHVFARAENGSGLGMTLALPPNATTIETAGDDLASTHIERDPDGRRLVQVAWKTRDVLDRGLTLSWTSPQSPLAEQWLIHAPVVPGAAEAKNFFAIVLPEGSELRGDGLHPGLERVPAWIRAELRGTAFSVAEAGAQLAVQPVQLPTVATAEAVIVSAKAELRLVADGSMQTAASWLVRHAAPLPWRLELPEGVEILTCTVGGKAARPVQREAGAVEIALPASGGEPTPVAITYAAKTEALDPVSGKVALAIPRTALFIERLDWSIALPDAFEVTAINGNVSVAAGAKQNAERAEQLIALRKELCRGERPTVELFYQRRGIDR